MAATDDTGSDLESGTAEVPELRRKYPVGMNLRDEQIVQFNRKYGIDPLVRPSETIHSHPYAAFERNYLEIKACKEINKLCPRGGGCVDVGSAGKRVRDRLPEVHCMIPILQPGDAARAAGVSGLVKTCTHTMQTCTCGPFTTALFTHSAYYMNEADLVKFHKELSSHVAFHVVHLFNSAYGRLCNGDLVYYYDGQTLHSRCKGNTHAYTHAPHFVQRQSAPHDGEGCLVADVVGSIGDTVLLRVEYVVGKLPAPPRRPSSLKQVFDPSTEGTMLGFSTSLAEALSATTIEYDRINAFGPVVILESSNHRASATVSRDAVNYVASKLIGRERGPTLWSNASYYAKARYSDANMPGDLLGKAVLVTAAIAMTLLVEEEMNLLQTMQSRWSSVFKVYNALLGWQPPRVWPVRLIVIGLVALGVVGVCLWFGLPEFDHLAGYLVLGLSLLGIGLISGFWWVSRIRARSVGEGWTEHLLSHEESSVVTSVGYIDAPTIISGSTAITSPGAVIEGLTVSYKALEPRKLSMSDTKPRLQHVGVAIDSIVPRIVEPTLESELSGVVNRLTRPPIPHDPIAMKAMDGWMGNSPDCVEFISRDIVITPTDVKSWVRKYSMARASELYKCYESVCERCKLSSAELVVRPFVKVEKKVDVTPLGPKKLATPRMVCAHSDEVLVVTCPFIARMFSHAKDTFDGRCGFVFAPGRSSEQLGEDLNRFASTCARPCYWSIDSEKFDAHHTDEHNTRFNRVCWLKGADDLTLSALEDAGSTLKTPHGVTARYDTATFHELKGIQSGEGATNFKGSLTTGGIARSNPSLTGRGGGVMSCGDDGAGCTDLKDDWTPDDLKSSLETWALRCGFKTTATVSEDPGEIDFCSKLFWPTSDGWVLAAKPGRLISRIGFLVIGPNEPNLKGVVISLLNDNHHVPVLGAFLKHLHKLLSREKARFGKSEWEGFHVTKRHEVHSEAVAMFTRRYDCTVAEMQELEDLLLSVERIPAIISSPLLLRMVERDEL